MLRAEEEEEDQLEWWLFAGIAAGFGGLSKYSMLFFAASAALYFYEKGTFKNQLNNKKLWLGVAAAALVYLPNLWWNTQHHFVSYLHTEDNATGQGVGFHPLALLEFTAAQLAVFGPILCVYLWKLSLRQGSRWKAFVVPMLSVIMAISLFSRAHANWAAPVYIAATLWVVSWLLETRREHWLKISLILHLVLAAVFYGFQPIINVTGIELTKKTDPFFHLRGQRELADAVREAHQKFPHTKLISEERRIVAGLLYYLRDGSTPAPIYKWNARGIIQDQYDLISNMNSAKGADFIMISRLGDAQAFFPYFQSHQQLKPIVITLDKDYTQTYQVYLLQGFKGY